MDKEFSIDEITILQSTTWLDNIVDIQSSITINSIPALPVTLYWSVAEIGYGLGIKCKDDWTTFDFLLYYLILYSVK